MIMEAIRQGLSEERIAKALSLDIASIRRKRDLLEGICPEAVQLLKEKRASTGAFREMRKVKPMRQIEMAELMVAANTFSAGYAQCLLAATPQEQLLEPDKPKEVRGLSLEDMSRMEREMENLGQDLRSVENSHGRNVLNLVLVDGLSQEALGEREGRPLPVTAQRRNLGRVPEDRRIEDPGDRRMSTVIRKPSEVVSPNRSSTTRPGLNVTMSHPSPPRPPAGLSAKCGLVTQLPRGADRRLFEYRGPEHSQLSRNLRTAWLVRGFPEAQIEPDRLSPDQTRHPHLPLRSESAFQPASLQRESYHYDYGGRRSRATPG